MNLRISASRRCLDDATLEKRLACLADAGPQAITDRLNQIENEWSAGRMTKATLGVLIIVGLGLGLLNSWWLVVPALGGLLLLQYLFTRTSGLGVLFQQVGFRSGAEIDQERFALKALRGDFRHLPTVHELENREDIARFEGEGGIALDPEEAKPDPREVVKEVIQAAKT
jgi:hypothetical protein